MNRARSFFRMTIAGLAVLLALPAAAAGAGRLDRSETELGVMLGEPTGLSGKWWRSSSNAIDAGLAWSFRKEGHLHVHADYLFHYFENSEIEDGTIPYYLGIGGRVRFEEEDTRVGVRFAAGLEYYKEDLPFGFFFEIAPILDIVPETELDVNGGIGVRYLF